MLNALISDGEARGNCGGQGRQLPAAWDTLLGQGILQDFFAATVKKKLSELDPSAQQSVLISAAVGFGATAGFCARGAALRRGHLLEASREVLAVSWGWESGTVVGTLL